MSRLSRPLGQRTQQPPQHPDGAHESEPLEVPESEHDKHNPESVKWESVGDQGNEEEWTEAARNDGPNGIEPTEDAGVAARFGFASPEAAELADVNHPVLVLWGGLSLVNADDWIHAIGAAAAAVSERRFSRLLKKPVLGEPGQALSVVATELSVDVGG